MKPVVSNMSSFLSYLNRFYFWILLSCFLIGVKAVTNKTSNGGVYLVNLQQGFGRSFDGIGAISGGGATSKLLRNYPEPQRSEILDYLFLPGFGASLQILKVEIGGDSQSTDGAEASHMHSEQDLNFHRGYEWWIMTEAKKRNPNIQFYGLPWTFPGWLGGGEFNPYFNRTKLVEYILNWIQGAKLVHDLDIDIIGVWNERPYDIEYIGMLKTALKKGGYGHVRIVAGDAMSWKIVDDYTNSTTLQQALDIIGYHYPGSYSPLIARNLPIPLWASEEFSAFNDIRGGGCWARVINEGYVNGVFNAYIAWNLIASYYDDLPYPRSSLMTANEPWSGHYEVTSPIWTTAHHTQFTSIGWKYLPHDSGSGNLTGNGTFVSYVSPDGKHLTVVIETFDPTDAPCFYHMPKYTVSENQTAVFRLGGPFLNVIKLYKWHSKFNFADFDSSVLFQQAEPVIVSNHEFVLHLRKNEIITLTTLNTGRKGQYPESPPTDTFPVPYVDHFEGYRENEEAYNLIQQAGTWEIVHTNYSRHRKVIRQMVPEPPIDTVRPERMPHPVALIGNFNWSDVTFSVNFYLPKEPEGAKGVFIAARVSRGGGWTMYSNGLYFWMYPFNNTVILTGNFSKTEVYSQEIVPLYVKTWYSAGMQVTNDTIICTVDGNMVLKYKVAQMPSVHGFLAIGTTEFKAALFDDLVIEKATIAKHPHKPFPNLN